LNMTATQAMLGDAWTIGETVSFEIIEITELTMKIKKSNGSIETWARVKSQKVEEKERLARAISMKPIVVNLSKERPGSKDQYLCIELEIVFKPVGVGMALPKLHPKVRETAIFHLSSLTYSEANTMSKIGHIKDSLLNILNPYAKGQIESIAIRNIMVTSRWKSVESFLSQYAEPVPKTEIEDGKKEPEEG